MTLDRFPGAPPYAYVSEEGWLVCGDQAWTEEEWRGVHGREWRSRHRIYDADEPKTKTAGRGRPRIHATDSDRRHAEYRRKRARELGISEEELGPTRRWRLSRRTSPA